MAICTGLLCAKNHVFGNAVPHIPGGGTVLYVSTYICYSEFVVPYDNGRDCYMTCTFVCIFTV